jgi:hypothetical protein
LTRNESIKSLTESLLAGSLRPRGFQLNT